MHGKTILTVFVFLCTIVITSCKKTESEPSCTTCAQGGGPGGSPGFNWKTNGNQSYFADSTLFVTSSKMVKAFYQGTTHALYIKVTSPAVGSYLFGTGTGNTLSFTKNGVAYAATSGTVSITKNASGKMSGNFTSYGNSGSITSLVGDFTDIEIH